MYYGNSYKIVAIIQARLTSTRLPRKILKKIGDKTVLEHCLTNVKKSNYVDQIVIATPHKLPIEAEQFIGSEEDVAGIGDYHCPRVLVDAFSPEKPGGTGKRIPTRLVESIGEQHPLWLAGGIGPENIADIVATCRPELVDASSRLESEPGLKHTDSMKAFFSEIEA